MGSKAKFKDPNTPILEWEELEELLLLTEMMECGRLVPLRRYSIEDTAMELRMRAEKRERETK
jgi:hypothetical protein